MRVTILGARGSIPVSGKEFLRYGGATTCFLVESEGTNIVLDAGTGLLNLPPEVTKSKRMTLLLSHTHADHMLGLPMCPFVTTPGARLDVYAGVHSGMDTETQVRRFMSPPLWPIGPENFPSVISFHPLPESITLGGVEVRTMEGRHPGGVSLMRLTAGGKCLVLATDCTVNDAQLEKTAAFARDCDLLLCDGQLIPSEWLLRSGYGHNTWNMAARLADACGAKSLRVVHHDPARTDAMLDAMSDELRAINPAYRFAKEGEIISL